MNIQPLADRVLIEPMAAEEVTVGGIIIPDSAKEKPLKGTVIAAGEGKTRKWCLNPEIRFYTANMPALNWNLTAKNILSCARAMYWL